MSFGERITPHFRVTSSKGQVRVKTSRGGNVIFQFRITVKLFHQISREEVKNIFHFLFLLSVWQEAIHIEQIMGFRTEITEI